MIGPMDRTLWERFNRPSVIFSLPTVSKKPEWQTHVSSPTLSEFEMVISNVKQEKAEGSDEQTPEIFKGGSPVLAFGSTEILAEI